MKKSWVVATLVIVGLFLTARTSPTATTTIGSNVPLPVELTRDVIYAIRPQQRERPGMNFTLDVCTPTEPGDWPVVVCVPGWGQTKYLWDVLIRGIAEQGVVAISINYPYMYPIIAVMNHGRGFREMAETVACAVRFARTKALDYGINAAHVTLVGFSLGGGAAAYVALVGDDLDRQWEEFAFNRGGPPPAGSL